MTNLLLSPRLPYLDGLTPDPEGVTSARTYAHLNRPAPMQRLEDFVMSLAYFYKDYAQKEGQRPTMTTALSEALGVFLFAASGFFAIVEDTYGPDGTAAQTAAEWKALSFGLMWARSQRDKAGQAFTAAEREAFSAALVNPHMLPLLPAWVGEDAAGRPKEAGRFGAWAALVYLLEHAALLEDGETEDTLAPLLEAFAQSSN